MTLKQKLLKLFMPAFFCFIFFTYLNTLPSIQRIYYPFFEQLTISAASSGASTVYFKSKEKQLQSANNYDEVIVLFNSKKHLQKLLKLANKTGQKVSYDYKGFVVNIIDTYVTPLIFFFSLFFIGTKSWRKRILGLVFGSIFLLGFTYFTVYLKSISMVTEAGVTGIDYHPKELEWNRLMAYVFSSVTTITVAILIWILLAFDKLKYDKESILRE